MVGAHFQRRAGGARDAWATRLGGRADTVFLKRLYVLLYMELATRRVIWFAVTDSPDATWVSQQARNVAWELTEIGVEARFLIRDHDAKFGGGSDAVLESAGIYGDQDSNRGTEGEFAHRAPNRLDKARVSGLAPYRIAARVFGGAAIGVRLIGG